MTRSRNSEKILQRLKLPRRSRTSKNFSEYLPKMRRKTFKCLSLSTCKATKSKNWRLKSLSSKISWKQPNREINKTRQRINLWETSKIAWEPWNKIYRRQKNNTKKINVKSDLSVWTSKESLRQSNAIANWQSNWEEIRQSQKITFSFSWRLSSTRLFKLSTPISNSQTQACLLISRSHKPFLQEC